MMNLLRFDETYAINTKLDPVEDILNLISTLKSLGFTLLRKVPAAQSLPTSRKSIKLMSEI